ncbi:uncharacterized protein C1orf106 [Columba livia]|uniref:Uncharacterized protein C1orf106 n=1 Tax=Columba livia TaxID=8932 RepID=A0A2I0M033_COLLI|nr:uncharacterized protein C1orf106 [Columba livia]
MGVVEVGGCQACPLQPQDPLSALERDLALQLQIAKAARRLCREENISKGLRKRRGRGGPPAVPAELSTSDESSLSDAILLEEEETQPPGHPTPKDPTEAEGLGSPSAPPSPWQETSLDRPYEKGNKPSVDPGDGETWGSRCYPRSPPVTPAAPGSPSRAASPAPRVGDVPPYRFVPIRTLVLCRQATHLLHGDGAHLLRPDPRTPLWLRRQHLRPLQRLPRHLPGEQQPRRLLPAPPAPTAPRRTRLLPPGCPPLPAACWLPSFPL